MTNAGSRRENARATATSVIVKFKDCIRMIDQEEKVLREFIKWSGKDNFKPKSVNASRTKSLVIAIVFWVIAGYLFLKSPVEINQILAFLSVLMGLVFIFMGSITGHSGNNIEYTHKFIDLEGARNRLAEIEQDNKK